MKFFDKEIDFELGPSHGFKQSGAICTCDLCQYMYINDEWYRIDLTEKEVIKRIEKCKTFSEFQEIINSLCKIT